MRIEDTHVPALYIKYLISYGGMHICYHALSFLKKPRDFLGYFWCLQFSNPLTPVHLSIHSFHVCLLLDQHTAGPVNRLCFLLSLTGILLWPQGIHDFLLKTRCPRGPSWQKLNTSQDMYARLICQYSKKNL